MKFSTQRILMEANHSTEGKRGDRRNKGKIHQHRKSEQIPRQLLHFETWISSECRVFKMIGLMQGQNTKHFKGSDDQWSENKFT
jgi:hypothetical protein